ncbi:gas vesicle protein GvpJ [Streptomyces sp. NPDC001978]|uniref:gas vesicle protein GvpJ n=2 Tax=unclassified Streptomyces TaxID=2593676 RepID=UPI0036C3212E
MAGLFMRGVQVRRQARATPQLNWVLALRPPLLPWSDRSAVKGRDMTMVPQSGGNVSRGSSGSIYDILELILDRGLVIDIFIRVSLLGIEILTVEIRIVVASVDTYLRFAEACNRLDLESGRKAPAALTDIIGGMTKDGAESTSKRALSGSLEAVKDTADTGGQGDESDEAVEEAEPRRRRSPARGLRGESGNDRRRSTRSP